MKVEYIDHMGTDLTVVNAARVSFDRESEGEPITISDSIGNSTTYGPTPGDRKLIRYLAKHNHWTPFGHCQATLRIKAPIFVARQLGKHQVGMVWNEVSRRYVDSTPEFYEPDVWRKRADNVKQGSSDDQVFSPSTSLARMYGNQALSLYQEMLDDGVCPEQARMVLPQSMYTEWYWTGSLAAWARVVLLRMDSHTQFETQQLAIAIGEHCHSLWPVSWQELLVADAMKHG